jgi:hypothetical protein
MICSRLSGFLKTGPLTLNDCNNALKKYSDTRKYNKSPETIRYREVSETGSAHEGYIKYEVTQNRTKINLY